jgi:nicotinate-nucleotide--dimethylbenzimidazole phosphoribosyltransferase
MAGKETGGRATGTRLEQLISGIEPVSEEWRQRARDYLVNLTAPPGSLGELLALAEQLAAIKRTLKPSVANKAIVTMAGDHGVVAEGVSAYPQEVTPQMVANFVAGGAAINVLARAVGARVLVVDMGVAADLGEMAGTGQILSARVAPGTRNISREAAMTREQAVQAIEAGAEIVAGLARDGVELVGTGDMGIGNTTPSSAILAAISGLPVSKVTGRGTGITDQALENKIRVIEQALQVNNPDPADPIDVLAKVGGFEIGGIAGVVLGAAYNRLPVVVDGFISTAGALLAGRIAPKAVGYMIAAHRSVEYGHQYMLDELGLKPLLNLNLRLGEGTGGALAMHIVDSATRIMREMATFDSAGVSKNTQDLVDLA